MGSGHEQAGRLATAAGKHVRAKLEQRCALSITRVLVAMTLFRCVKREMPRFAVDGCAPNACFWDAAAFLCCGVPAAVFQPPAAISRGTLGSCASIDHPQKQSITSIKNKEQLLLQGEACPEGLWHYASLHVVLYYCWLLGLLERKSLIT